MPTAALVRRGTHRLARRLRAERDEAGVPVLALSVLSHLAQYGPMTAKQLANTDRLKPQTLTRSLNRLEEDGLIARKQDDTDRRQSQIEVTEAGRRRLRDDVRPGDAWLAEAMRARLTSTERELMRLAGTLMMRLAEDDPSTATPLP